MMDNQINNLFDLEIEKLERRIELSAWDEPPDPGPPTPDPECPLAPELCEPPSPW